jgi:hypothetical protein
MRVLNLLEGVVEAGHHQMGYDHVLDALLQDERAAHKVIDGDRRRNCSLASTVPTFVAWANQVEMSRAEGDVHRESAYLQQPSH